MARGKNSRPGAVSGPSRLSQRTDLTPASQPVRVASGQPYGDRQAMESLQQSAPMSAGAPLASPPSQSPSQAGVAAVPGGVFGPTQRPAESPLTGIQGPRRIPDDPNQILRMLYEIYPHPDIARLIDPNDAP